MRLVIDRFEDNELAVLETPEGESLNILRSQLPWYASEGDVVYPLPEDQWQGLVRFAIDEDETLKRLEEAQALRASLPQVDEGDLEL
jgi:hypothetical protein